MAVMYTCNTCQLESERQANLRMIPLDYYGVREEPLLTVLPFSCKTRNELHKHFATPHHHYAEIVVNDKAIRDGRNDQHGNQIFIYGLTKMATSEYIEDLILKLSENGELEQFVYYTTTGVAAALILPRMENNINERNKVLEGIRALRTKGLPNIRCYKRNHLTRQELDKIIDGVNPRGLVPSSSHHVNAS